MSSFVALEAPSTTSAYQLKRDPVELRLANDTQTDPLSGKPFSLRHLDECLGRGAPRFGGSAARRTRLDARSGRHPDRMGRRRGAYPGDIAPTVATVRLKADGEPRRLGRRPRDGTRDSHCHCAGGGRKLGLDPRNSQRHHRRHDRATPTSDCGIVGYGTTAGSRRTPFLRARCDDHCVWRRRERRCTSGTARPPIARARVRSGAGQQPPDRDGRTREQGVVAIGGPEFPDFVTFSYIAHFVEVRVHPADSRARVSRIVTVADCGRVVSKRTASSQIYGGLVWGIGAALAEQSEVDPRFGGFLNTNIAEYAIPVNADIGRSRSTSSTSRT